MNWIVGAILVKLILVKLVLAGLILIWYVSRIVRPLWRFARNSQVDFLSTLFSSR